MKGLLLVSFWHLPRPRICVRRYVGLLTRDLAPNPAFYALSKSNIQAGENSSGSCLWPSCEVTVIKNKVMHMARTHPVVCDYKTCTQDFARDFDLMNSSQLLGYRRLKLLTYFSKPSCFLN